MERVLIIGRGESCDVVLEHPSVSREHAELHLMEDGSLIIVDRNSTNGTTILGATGERRVQRERLHDGERVRFGSVEMQLPELLESARLKRPELGLTIPQEPRELPEPARSNAEPAPEYPVSYPQAAGRRDERHWARGANLVRCQQCGAIKNPTEACRECGS